MDTTSHWFYVVLPDVGNNTTVTVSSCVEIGISQVVAGKNDDDEQDEKWHCFIYLPIDHIVPTYNRLSSLDRY